MYAINLAHSPPSTTASRYNGWAAVCRTGPAVDWLAFHEDNTICRWDTTSTRRYYLMDGYDPSSLLMPSRIRTRVLAQVPP